MKEKRNDKNKTTVNLFQDRTFIRRVNNIQNTNVTSAEGILMKIKVKQTFFSFKYDALNGKFKIRIKSLNNE